MEYNVVGKIEKKLHEYSIFLHDNKYILECARIIKKLMKGVIKL